MTVFTWTISQLERDLSPAELAGAVITAHWRVSASQEVDGVEYTAGAYGSQGFTPDPTAPDYIAYEDLTEEDVLGWIWADGVDKDEMEANLQSQIDLQITPVTASGIPWDVTETPVTIPEPPVIVMESPALIVEQ